MIPTGRATARPTAGSELCLRLHRFGESSLYLCPFGIPSGSGAFNGFVSSIVSITSFSQRIPAQGQFALRDCFVERLL